MIVSQEAMATAHGRCRQLNFSNFRSFKELSGGHFETGLPQNSYEAKQGEGMLYSASPVYP